jgi:hypothetical protein
VFNLTIIILLYHSKSKFRVSPTEAFRKTTFTEVSSSKFLRETSGFSNRNFGFFEPKLRVFEPKLRVFENRSFVFLKQSCSFYKDFFVLPKLRALIPGFFATETSEHQIHTKFLTKFRLSANRRNSRSFVRK